MSNSFTKFALVVPTLNEAGNICAVLERAVASLSKAGIAFEILVVDDESSDSTPQLVTQYGTGEPRVRLLQRHGQRGLAGAITYGWAHTDAGLLGVMDADLQHPPELLPALLQAAGAGFDVAIASRYVQPHSMNGWSPARRLISRLGVMLSAAVQNPAIRVKDPLSGYFVVRRHCIEGLSFQPEGFKLLLEILAKGRINSISEIPFKFATRHRGTSKANAMTAVHYIVLLYNLSRYLIFGARGISSRETTLRS